jgi:hypothetical protein
MFVRVLEAQVQTRRRLGYVGVGDTVGLQPITPLLELFPRADDEPDMVESDARWAFESHLCATGSSSGCQDMPAGLV